MSEIWVTRDRIDTTTCCGVFRSKKKPEMFESGAYPVADDNLTLKKFVKIYKFVPEKGSCERYGITLTKIQT